MADLDTDITNDDNTSFLDMSDEDLINFDPSTLNAAKPNTDTETNVDPAAKADDTDVETTKVEAEPVSTPDPAANVVDPMATTDATTSTTAPVVPPTTNTETPAPEATAEVIDYKAAYEQLLKPFKANGREVQPKSVEDAITLMQMGANYNKKMAGMKPAMKLLKMLEANGLMDEQKIGFLIDLDKKSPEAINKLVQDSGIDPLDLSAEKAGAYKPGNHAVDERELELDKVLGELEGSPAYARTLEVVSQQWDANSKKVIAGQPEILKVINGHVENGMYDLIAKEMDSERTFGRLNGLSDIEAYRQVGDAINARGGFAHLVQQHQMATTPAVVQVVVPPNPNKAADEAKLRDQKRAVSAPKATAPASNNLADFNPLSMPDDEFLNQTNLRFQ